MLEEDYKISITKKIVKNFLWLFLQTGVLRFFGFLLTLILARNLNQSDFGKFTYITSLVNIFLIIADMGISSLLLREVSRQRELTIEIFPKLFSIKLPLVILAFISFVVMLIFSPAVDTKQTAVILAVAYLLVSISTFISVLFKAHEKMHLLLIGDFIYKALLITACWFVLRSRKDLHSIVLVYLVAGIIVLLFYLISSCKYFRYGRVLVGIKEFVYNFFTHIKMSVPLALGGIIMVIYINTDVVVLKWMKGESVTGLYGISYGFYLGITIIASLLVQSLFPRLSYALEKSQKEVVGMILSGSIKLLTLISVPLALGGVLLSSKLILFFYGERYIDSNSAFQIFMFAMIINFFNTLFSYYLFAARKQGVVNKIFFVSVSLNIILNLILIPKYSLNGAAFATLLAELLFFLLFLFLYPDFILYFRIQWIIYGLLSVSVLSLFLLAVRNILPLIPVVLSGMAIYIMILIVTGIVKEEKELLQMIFKGKMQSEQKNITG
jgi:O-antigen/teichoic acid export membrane protein